MPLLDIQFNVDAALQKLTTFAQTNGPQALHYAEQAVRVEAVGYLISGVVALAASCAFFSVVRIQWKHNTDYDKPFAFAWAIPGTLTFIFAAVQLMDPWNWAAAFAPRLWLAHMVVQKALG